MAQASLASESKPTFLRYRIQSSLILEDGTSFTGYAFGAPVETDGEVVFSTSMVGYPEALTDPSYRGQILCLTYPLVGNYGVPSNETDANGLPLFFESDRIQTRALIIHDLCDMPSHHQSARTLDEWLRTEGIPGIFGIDTRRLARTLRERGVMLGCLKRGKSINLELPASIPNPNLSDLVKEVSVNEPTKYYPERENSIVLIDCGVKYGIIRSLLKRNLAVVRMPYNSTAEEILDERPIGVIVSNGPGDPKTCTQTIRTVREIMERRVPLLGICLGNQIIPLAAGADTYKMKYGHRSQNQPVVDVKTGRCYITTQNHGYAVDKFALERAGFEVWFVNANDQSVEGVKHLKKPVWAVQWHPEACPGPTDTEFIFDFFIKEALETAKA